METSLLQTKLYIPPPRPELVPRLRLIERLNAGLGRKLTLISAPAGFGKTMLVSEWVTDSERPVAWLSLDESDNAPTRFLTYFVAALQTVEADIGNDALSALQSPQPPPIEVVLTGLINEIAVIPDRIVLVLDDYHLIEAQPSHDALTFLLEHLPPQMHLLIATREDPLSRKLFINRKSYTKGEENDKQNNTYTFDICNRRVFTCNSHIDTESGGEQGMSFGVQCFVQFYSDQHSYATGACRSSHLLASQSPGPKLSNRNSIYQKENPKCLKSQSIQMSAKKMVYARWRARAAF